LKPVSIVVDNGEELLEKCINSLRNQTVEPRIVIAMGPRSDRELCESLADKVYGPFKGIGEGRTYAIVKEEANHIISADADTIYAPDYVEYATLDLKTFPVVKAGTITFHEPSPLGFFESTIHHLIPYEYALSFRRNVILNHGIHLEDYSNPRSDIGYYMYRKGLFPIIDFRLRCKTRLPTYGCRKLVKYIPAALGAIVASSIPLAIILGGEIIQKTKKQ